MAQTYVNNDNVLSKVKFGNTTYYMKDAAARAILDTFGTAATYDVANTIAEDGTGLITAGVAYDFIVNEVGGLGDVINLLSASDHTQVASPAKGDFVVESDGSEWLYDGTAWREVGSEGAYVLKTFEIAGIDMADDISAAELKEALELGALAYKDSGSVKITTIDSLNSFTTGKAGTYDVSSTAVSVPATFDTLDVTPSGSVSLTAGTAAAATYDKTTSVTVAAATPGENQEATYVPAGSVSVTDISITPSSTSVATVTSSGTGYSLTAGSCIKGSDTTGTFATEGLTASVGTGDDAETLIFAAASTSSAVTASGSISYTDPSLSGALPTFGSADVMTGISNATATASFSGTGVVLSATPAHTATAATVTQPTFTASFTGTAASVTPTVATTTSAAGTDAQVTVASETITPTANSTEKTATVTFA